MADGYARASGKTAVVIVPNIGLPNAMTQIVNTFKDRIPLLVVVAAFGQDQLGRDGPQDYEHQEVMVQPITKWYWQAGSAAGIPETTRRALKFASTAPAGPVFLAIPDNRLRTDAKDVEAVARLLIEAKNPMLSIGDEVTMAHGEAETLQLAELLGLAG